MMRQMIEVLLLREQLLFNLVLLRHVADGKGEQSLSAELQAVTGCLDSQLSSVPAALEQPQRNARIRLAKPVEESEGVKPLVGEQLLQ
jgi:hypothetical protein